MTYDAQLFCEKAWGFDPKPHSDVPPEKKTKQKRLVRLAHTHGPKAHGVP